ncbi:MAG: cyclase family protein [Acidobacteria bacterium]|nr:cyclase family protein [Acidobacteriota bacterium]
MSTTRCGFTLPGKASIAVLLVSSAVVAAQLSGCAAAPTDEEPPPAPPGPETVAGWRMVDLSHAYAGDTLYWPTDTDGFRLDTLAEGETPGGYFYAAKAFATAEHGGTHLDAPFHFAEEGDDAASIPLDRLILPGIVIDVSEAAAADPDYLVTVEDIAAWEDEHGRVPAGSAVLIRTGWAARWPDALAYLGDDTPGETGNLHFPGIGEAATRLLVEERRAGRLGIDTASIDHGQSTDFIAHQIGAAAGVPNLENVADLSGLPPTGFLLAALPMKIERGTGAPVRIVALIP